MSRDSITLASLLPAGCTTAEQYVTSIITEARTREGRTLEGWTFDPTEATLCMMKATKAVNDAWDEVPIDDPRANDDDAYIIALDRAFRSIVADRDRIRTAIEQPATEEPTIEEPTDEELPAIEPPTAEEEPTIEEPTASEPVPTIDEQPAIEVPAASLQAAVEPQPSQPSMTAPYQPSDLDNPDCTIMIDGQTYRDQDGDYHHVNSDETLYVSIPQNLEGVTSAELAGDDHEVLRVAMEQHGCKPIDTPNALLRILKDYGLVHTMHEVLPDPEPTAPIDEPAIEQPAATEEQPTAPSVEQPSMDASPAPVLTAPAPAPSNDPKATPAEVAAVLSTMPDLATSTAVAIRKAAPNFKLMFSIDAVANAARIEWSMPDPTHVTLTATEEDGTIWQQREDVKNGGRRVTVTEADGTTTIFKSVGKLIAYLNGQCALEDAIKSSKKVAKPAASPQAAIVPVGHVQEKEPQPAAPIEQPAPIERPASEAAPIEQPSMDAPIDEPTIDEPTIDEQPSAPSVEEQPSLDTPIDEIAEAIETEPAPVETAPTTPNIPKAAATATTEPQREQKHHPKYNDILALVKAGLHIYMYGPAGSGKSTIVQQIAEEMGLKYYITPAPTMEHQLFGFIDANGTYHRTPFRDAYEFGGVSDHPEVDKMVSDLGPALNDAVSNTCYAFPDGVVKKHPDFHFCMSGNTSGHGADGAYVGRHQQDAAFLDRFEVIRIDYDVEVEKKISIDLIGKVDEDAIEFIHDYRKVLSECRPNDVVSPRRLGSLIICAHKAYPGDYEKAVETAVVRDLADQKDDLRNVVMAMQPDTNNPYYCALRTIVQRLFGKGRNKSVAA